jgi:DNA invertase Pin-like site-specific DNA recombinase
MIIALYARVSTVKQAEKDLSIPDQLRQLREWCERQGHGVAAEYVEPGASATNDRRPVFQQMMAEAGAKPRPFEAILVYSQSRLFRNALKFAIYEDRLQRAGVKLLSLTEPISDDPAGKFTRHVLSAVHELQSEETGANTLRTMTENARRGFFNGSHPPFGYRVVEVDLPGRQGRKKRLELDPAEAELVRQVFTLYLQGKDGHELGLVGVARTLNRQGLTYRGTAWTKGRVEGVLSNRAYLGEYTFNRTRGKTGQRKPEAEWVRVAVPALLDRGTFEAAARRRKARHCSQIPPRVVSAPSFLTGLLRCGHCGAGLTVATGKGGRYRYYKCQRRIGTGERCATPTLPTPKLDRAVRETLCKRVLTRERVLRIMEGLRSQLQQGGPGAGETLRRLRQDLEGNRLATDRLHQAVETGRLPLDDLLQVRAHRLKARREAILAEIAGLQRVELMPKTLLSPRYLDAFCQALRARLMDEESGFGKRYLQLLVEEIRVEGDQVVIRGSDAAMARVVAGSSKGTPDAGVPSIGPGWLPMQGSN